MFCFMHVPTWLLAFKIILDFLLIHHPPLTLSKSVDFRWIKNSAVFFFQGGDATTDGRTGRVGATVCTLDHFLLSLS